MARDPRDEWSEAQDHRYEQWRWAEKGINPFFRKAGEIRTPGFGRKLIVVSAAIGIAAWFLHFETATKVAISITAAIFLLIGISNVRHERT